MDVNIFVGKCGIWCHVMSANLIITVQGMEWNGIDFK
jgi:hypothetical protein